MKSALVRRLISRCTIEVNFLMHWRRQTRDTFDALLQDITDLDAHDLTEELESCWSRAADIARADWRPRSTDDGRKVIQQAMLEVTCSFELDLNEKEGPILTDGYGCRTLTASVLRLMPSLTPPSPCVPALRQLPARETAACCRFRGLLLTYDGRVSTDAVVPDKFVSITDLNQIVGALAIGSGEKVDLSTSIDALRVAAPALPSTPQDDGEWLCIRSNIFDRQQDFVNLLRVVATKVSSSSQPPVDLLSHTAPSGARERFQLGSTPRPRPVAKERRLLPGAPPVGRRARSGRAVEAHPFGLFPTASACAVCASPSGLVGCKPRV